MPVVEHKTNSRISLKNVRADAPACQTDHRRNALDLQVGALSSACNRASRKGVSTHPMKTRTRLTDLLRRVVSLCLCEMMVFLPYLQKSYLELFDLAPSLHFSAQEIHKQRKSFAKGEESCDNRFKDHVKRYQKQLDTAREDLKKKTKKEMSREER